MKTLRFASVLCIVFLLTQPLLGNRFKHKKAAPAFVPVIVRGPYLQSVTANSAMIRWRTSEPADSRVRIGETVNALNKIVDEPQLKLNHEIKITNLQPGKRYYYAIGTTSMTLEGNADNYFETAPVAGTAGKYRFAAFGDCGNNSANQKNVRDRVAEYFGTNYMNAWLLLGDNAYANGTDAEYQTNFFDVYKDRFLKQNPLFPCPGNHEYANNATRQNDHAIAYYDIFSVPQNGEAGGVASGTEAFYSFDYGNVHFLALDSYGKEDNASRLYDTLGKQALWVKQDLAANSNKDWVVAYWHHPPYTKGSHNSDTESELVKIRENFVRILERYGVDLVLCGHSHDYERSKLMRGHYGIENTFDPASHLLSNSSGKYDLSPNSCPYIKQSDANKGTVYVVAGSAGQAGGTSPGFPHDALPVADATHGGALVLEVESNRLDAKWICADGIIRDAFTIVKDVNVKQQLNVNAGSEVTLTASYPGSYLWNSGATTRQITISPQTDTTYTVADGAGCLADTFSIQLGPPLPVKMVSFKGSFNEQNTVTLDWATSFEQNASHFAIERSVDAVHFKTIASIEAKGNSTELQTYSWTDHEVLDLSEEVFYYRLRQTDTDGKSELSRTLSIHKRNAFFNDLIIFPNPTNGNFKVKYLGARTLSAEISLYSLTGERQLVDNVNFTSNKEITISKKLHSGIYFLQIRSGDKEILKRIAVK